MMSGETIVERRDGLVMVTFKRPDKKNAVNATSWADLGRVLTEIAGNPATLQRRQRERRS